MKRYCLLLPLAAAAVLSAQPKQKQQHAHSHGSAKIDIGVEGSGGTVEFEAAAQAIIGFEHQPKTPADRKQADAALAALKARFSEIVVLPAALGCKLTPVKAEFEVDGSHGEVHATFRLQCSKPLQGAEVQFGVTKVYPGIEEVQVQAVSDGGQTGATIRKDKGSVKIG